MTDLIAGFWRFFDNVMQRLNALNMTNARQLNSLVLIAATGAVYLFLAIKFAMFGGKPWTPDYEWLGFLLLLSGLDWRQFSSKRTTDAAYVEAMQKAKQPTDTTTTTLVAADRASGSQAQVSTVTAPSA